MKFGETVTPIMGEKANARGNEEAELSPEAANISKELELFRQNFGKDLENNFITAYAKIGSGNGNVRTEMGFNLKSEGDAERFNGQVDSQELLEFIRDINLFYNENDKSPLASAMGGLIDKRVSSFIKQQLVKKLASLLHDEWREPRRKEDGTYEPRVRKTEDEAWIEKHGADELDIANTSYENLPEDWKGDNKASAEVAIGLVRAQAKRGNPLENNEEFLEKASEVIHTEWLKRNRSRASEVQKKPYEELPEDEKESDRAIIRKAIEIYTSSQPAAMR